MTLFPDNIYNPAAIALQVARSDPDRVAVIEPCGRAANGKRCYRHYSYARLSADVEAIAPGLREMGIAEGTRTVSMAPPSYEACVIHLALTRVGATLIWIDPAVGYLNVGERLRRVEPDAFVGVPAAHLGRMVFGWGPRWPRKAIVIGTPAFPGARTLESLKRTPPAEPLPPSVHPDDPAAILYTTGSTGPAKPVLYLHRHFCQTLRTSHKSWRFNEENGVPVDMPAFPAFYFVGLSAGGTVVVPPIDFVRQGPAKAKPKDMLEVINDCGVKTMFGSPVLLENLGRYAAAHGIKTPTLKRLIGGGSPIVASSIRLLLEMMGGNGEVAANYGATEVLPITEMGSREALVDTWKQTEQGRGICVGRPFEGVEIKVIAIIDGVIETISDARPLPPGAIGEIIVRGGHVSPAYFRDADNTRKNKIKDETGGVWHRLGDVGYLDDGGLLWYCGRVSQRVDTRNGSLFSFQCEPIFDMHPKVCRCGLVSVMVEGEAQAVICVETRHDVRERDLPMLREELLQLAAQHTVTRGIKQVLFKRKLPVDPRHNSKIERPKLAVWAASVLEPSD